MAVQGTYVCPRDLCVTGLSGAFPLVNDGAGVSATVAYESDIRRGLIVWKLSDDAVAGAMKLGRLNPQTQETSFPLKAKGK